MDVAGFRPRRAASIATFALLTLSIGCSLLGPTTATSFLKRIESSPDPNERYKAYEKLASERCYDNNEQREHAVKVLLAGLEPNKEPIATRAVICRTLGILGDPAGRVPMIRLVRDSEVLIRTEACRSLGKLGRPEDSTILMQMMKLDDNPDCKIAAIEALGALKSVDPRTPEYLVLEMERSDDPAIRLACLQSLRKITGKDLGVKADAWRDGLAKGGSDRGRTQAPVMAKGATLDPAATPASTGRRP
jgi:HEAT repeat protein